MHPTSPEEIFRVQTRKTVNKNSHVYYLEDSAELVPVALTKFGGSALD